MTERFVKRTFDLFVAALLLLITLPVIVLCALVSLVSLRTSPFFTQTRVGRDGRPFRFLKIRTLPKSAPKYASKYDLAEVRVPRATLFLRELHLDELPQLFLVLCGRMSLVGPRPEMPQLYAEFEPDLATSRTAVRPGCTGLWQISEYCDQLIYEHPEFDRYYLEHRSLRLDVWVLMRTLRIHAPGGRKHVVRMTELPNQPAPLIDLRYGNTTIEEVLVTERIADPASALRIPPHDSLALQPIES